MTPARPGEFLRARIAASVVDTDDPEIDPPGERRLDLGHEGRNVAGLVVDRRDH